LLIKLKYNIYFVYSWARKLFLYLFPSTSRRPWASWKAGVRPLPVFSLVYIFRSSFKAKPKPGPLGLEPDLLLLAAIFFLLLLDFGFRQQNGLAAGKNIGNLQGEFLGQVDQAPLLPVFSYHLDYRS